MRVLITAFGGGHTGVALACLKKIGGDVCFVVLNNDDLTKMKLTSLGFRYSQIIEPRGLGENIASPSVIAKFFLNALQAIKILMKEKPEIVISTGPNPSIPISFIAKIFGKKLINVEAVDRVLSPSITARILSWIADETWVHWSMQMLWFRNSRLIGPLLYEQSSGLEIILEKPVIAVFSGRRPYYELLEAVRYIDGKITCSWILQTAGAKLEVKNKAIISDYFVGISDLIEKSDCVITTGGLTAFEVLAKRRNLILFPRKSTSADHQLKQAIYLSRIGKCWYAENKVDLELLLKKILVV
ncbi:MAG: glycosyltransferase [Candidatus Methanosuratincola petrocarbonis]